MARLEFPQKSVCASTSKRALIHLHGLSDCLRYKKKQIPQALLLSREVSTIIKRLFPPLWHLFILLQPIRATKNSVLCHFYCLKLFYCSHNQLNRVSVLYSMLLPILRSPVGVVRTDVISDSLSHYGRECAFWLNSRNVTRGHINIIITTQQCGFKKEIKPSRPPSSTVPQVPLSQDSKRYILFKDS